MHCPRRTSLLPTPPVSNSRTSGLRLFLACFTVLALLASFALSQDNDEGYGPPTLAVGSAAPDFCLLGIDGQTHCLQEYSGAKVLMIAFICNHCPTAQLYETRIKKIAEDYKDRGVTVLAIEPNNPNAVRLDEMGYTDVGDSPEEMKIRAEYRQFQLPLSLRWRDPEDFAAVWSNCDAAHFYFRRRSQASMRRASG